MYIKKIVVAILLLGLIGAGIFAYVVYSTFFTPNTSFNNKEAFVYIGSNDSFADVKEQMEPLLTDVSSFQKAAERKGYASNIRGGKYRITKGMTNNDIINNLRVNNIPVRVSFNNQENTASLAGRISEQIEADSLSLLKAFDDGDFLEGNGFDQESKLALYIPNSYEFFWNTSAEEFRDRMLKEYQRFWNEDRLAKAKAQNMSPNEVVALASIVHKETAKVDERPRVAGVYVNRLKAGMLLQADPTVIYAIKKETGNYDTIIKRVLYRDLEMDSPYNTYKYAGVPPGPITMPDISAVDAVLNPEKHNYYYFVANVEDFGYHMFAENIAQHNRNKEQYIRWLNAQKINR
ncbi:MULTISPECIES: endolytic transglycosylase MltG [Maribacter]|uniref:Endolytic murein transglycosylase n=1 Tax=Maribacter flavus TaxID=1658664 RepID=A0A5B2TTM3_9FLAO|nr:MULTISPECIES: endolytic transglycosylase MltG [Maribacter]KAA2216870.1 endolytic transglycosylase MltG [Maribacter flavus]MDC6405991.1 endolytic transglycosylase MltG [Maribacter sp. PR66]MEE1973224.1 endolytic transglycosylase MltG [Maribacter flavus]